MNKCKHCNKDTKNPIFCSRSCAAQYNNVHFPKRKIEGKCKKCNKSIPKRNKLCDDCRVPDKFLQEAIYKRHHKSSAYALIRSRARKIAKDLNWNNCKNCGYDKHIEICHINPIGSYPQNTLISIINSPENLIPLCPNCHWEFDHGLLNLYTIQDSNL